MRYLGKIYLIIINQKKKFKHVMNETTITMRKQVTSNNLILIKLIVRVRILGQKWCVSSVLILEKPSENFKDDHKMLMLKKF